MFWACAPAPVDCARGLASLTRASAPPSGSDVDGAVPVGSAVPPVVPPVLEGVPIGSVPNIAGPSSEPVSTSVIAKRVGSSTIWSLSVMASSFLLRCGLSLLVIRGSEREEARDDGIDAGLGLRDRRLAFGGDRDELRVHRADRVADLRWDVRRVVHREEDLHGLRDGHAAFA